MDDLHCLAAYMSCQLYIETDSPKVSIYEIHIYTERQQNL